jgi:transcriptional regulator with XRE-family HTH domain
MVAAETLDQRLASRIRALRAERELSLEELSDRSGVSRSMISLIERGETSPTAVTLEKLATGLGVVLASLFLSTDVTDDADGPVSRRATQLEWTDPASGYRRRVLSPGVPHPIQLIEVHFPAGARVAFESGARAPRVYQQVWLLHGRMEITVGKARHRLDAGDCLAMELDQPVMFHNPTRKTSRYAVVITGGGVS